MLVQNLPADAPDLFVTLNPAAPPAPERVLRRLTLSHPLVSQASTRAQQRLPEVQVSVLRRWTLLRHFSQPRCPRNAGWPRNFRCTNFESLATCPSANSTHETSERAQRNLQAMPTATAAFSQQAQQLN